MTKPKEQHVEVHLFLFGDRVFFLPWRILIWRWCLFLHCLAHGISWLCWHSSAGAALGIVWCQEGSPSIGSLVLGLWSWKAQSVLPLPFCRDNASHCGELLPLISPISAVLFKFLRCGFPVQFVS